MARGPDLGDPLEPALPHMILGLLGQTLNLFD
jgi:hypothetical protein